MNALSKISSQTQSELAYLTGFGSHFATEAEPGALPEGRNSPQRHALGLYAELISGTPFTVARHEQRRSWLYRIRPTANHPAYVPIENKGLAGPLADPTPNRLRWSPFPAPEGDADFLDSLTTIAATSEPTRPTGMAVHIYCANRSMTRTFMNADGELLIVPQAGALRLTTECGRLDVTPGEVALVPRGMVFRVDLLGESARGYVCENFGAVLRLPELGPIGSNGLANPRDFLSPVAWYEDRDEPTEVVQKFCGKLWSSVRDHSPFDVVAWHGNCAPYKYDLARFNTIGSVSFDHPDPSIYTVLTSPSDTPGTANVDFVIFPPRWMVAEDTFRPPWYHRNIMNEFMGLVHGAYDAKAEGFLPGGMSLHSCMNAHGPDAESAQKARDADLTPTKIDNTLAFMFETRDVIVPTRTAMTSPALQSNYDDCWNGIPAMFRR